MNNLYLKSFLKCERKAWLDFKGNKSYKIWSPYKPIERINQYQSFYKLSNGDLYAGSKACRLGSKGVIGLKIKDFLMPNIIAEIYPQLLVKSTGETKWGKYKYIPAVYKLGHQTTREHLLDLAFCSILLEPFQESKIEKGLVISNFANKINIEKISLNKKFRKQALNIFLNLNQSLKGSMPDITKNRKKCTICEWKNFCDKEAKDNYDLTDIDGIGSKTAVLLKKIGISNIKELAFSSKDLLEEKLSKFNEQKYAKTSKFLKQAESYISGKPLRIFKDKNLSNLISKKNSGFFVFDIESNPDEKHDFLYGFLTVNNLFEKIKEDVYEPILNIDRSNNMSNKKVIDKLFLRRNWPVLHYGETEKIAILNLAEDLNLNLEEIESLKSRFIDLHTVIRETWILPIKNYSLKTVANWTGFEWKQKNASGSHALYWWTLYQANSNDVFLKKIIKYNLDDCLATLHISKWLLKNQ